MTSDETAEFQQLAVGSLDSLHNYAALLARQSWEAEDLLQEALARGFEAFHRFDRTLSYKAWMFTIVRNTHIDRQRRRRRSPVEDHAWDEAQGEALAPESPLSTLPLAPDAILVRRERIEQVRAAIRRLPTPLREVLELRDVEGLSYQEIARIVNRPIGTVMSRLHRGRSVVRRYLLAQAPGRQEAGTRDDGL